MPKLQTLNGCFEDAARPHQLGGLDIYRCPRTLVAERELRVLGYFRDELIKSLSPREVRGLPFKLVEAIGFVTELSQVVLRAE